MATFGKKLKECREAKGFSHNELTKAIPVHHYIIDKYERDEVKPTIDVVKKMAEALDTTAGYLMGESKYTSALKDLQCSNALTTSTTFPKMIKSISSMLLMG